MTPGFQAIDIGTVGRRAVAWFLKDNLTVLATDADAADHAMGVVLEALRRVGRSHEGNPFYPWTEELRAAFPALPDDVCTAHELMRGSNDPDVAAAVGYGYVRPAAHGHECGGALFHQARRSVQYIQRHSVWLVSGRPQ